MGKFEKKKEKKKFPWGVLALVAVLVILGVAGAKLLPSAGSGNAEQTAPPEETAAVQSQTQAQEQPAADEGVALPMQLEDGKLTLEMLFQYSGLNPDCGNQEGENVAAVQLTNSSSEYLQEAKLCLTAQDGTLLNFYVTDVPAGETVMAFCVDNLSVEANPACAAVSCQAVFTQADASAGGKVSVSAEGVVITVNNVSGEDLSNVVVYCRSVLGEEYFGGVTYAYTIENLPAGETAVVEAWDCILGMAEVVRTAVGES